MNDIYGDTPGIARESIVLLVADFEKDVAFDKAAGLLVRVGMFGQNMVFGKNKFGH